MFSGTAPRSHGGAVGADAGTEQEEHSGRLAPSDLDRLEREIASTDAQIDDLVYDLYGITEEERAIIEGVRS